MSGPGRLAQLRWIAAGDSALEGSSLTQWVLMRSVLICSVRARPTVAHEASAVLFDVVPQRCEEHLTAADVRRPAGPPM